MNKIIDQMLKDRQTVKAYSDKKISEGDWKQILETIYWAPSSLGFEPYRVLIVEKESELRKELQPLMWGQGTIVEADKLIFFVTLKKEAFMDKKFIKARATRMVKEIMGKKGVTAATFVKGASMKFKNFLKDFQNNDQWAEKQAYIALGASLNVAAILGIGSTPMEGMDTHKVTEFLQSRNLINSDEQVSLSAGFGYPKSKTAYSHFGSGKRVREPWDKKFTTVK